MATEKLPILIASASSDEETYRPVCEILERRDFSTIVYKTDKVLKGDDQFTVEVNTDGAFAASYEGRLISPERIGAAWFRKIANFSLADAGKNHAKQLYMNNEVRALHDTIWPLYPDDIWLNSPNAIAKADRKLGQLIIARETGFSVPSTVISSDWSDLRERLQTKDRQIIVKMLRGIISDKHVLKALYTTPLNDELINQLSKYAVPFPGMYQPFIEKSKEWRITVVGDNVFPVAIYTDDSAKDDWRKHQTTKAVRFAVENAPDSIAESCVKYLGKVGLKYGAFDFIEKPDGETVFLECNPNGQYGWLEDQLGLPISQAIADELVAIARSH